ncbi:hypothetical protein Zm00014a_026927 [Zea mays]|jgi:hypothetical protein|uniref:Uncharacterized protein n=2 Tax=Zea mays TaxID=4577 RepID=A0A1D6FJS3_MAIZE|nr:hypothetical protein ZEAMMB73_Zm00001d009501 [Zea mays]PWZ10701.1 hypothetical protein Zm00014a_026927 [Zea mays]
MGNSLQLPCPCVCHRCHDDTTAVAGSAKRRRKRKQPQQQRPDDSGRNVRAAARPGHVVPVVEAAEDGGRDRETWPECSVEPGQGGGVRVRIVVRRQDIAQLVARFEQRVAEEERIAAGSGATMSPCRDAWRPRLSIIPENY